MGVDCGVGGFLVAEVLRMSAFGKDKIKTACKNLISS